MTKAIPLQFRRRKVLAELLQTSPRRVHDLLRTSIRDGLLRPDDRLTEDYLIRELATSRNAVREGLQMLSSQGIVKREPRIGTTVVGGLVQVPVNNVSGQGIPDNMRIERLEDRLVPSTALIRSKLHTDAARVGMIEHLYSIDDRPIGVRVAYYHGHITQPESWEECPDMDTAFEFVFGLPLGWAETRINAVTLESRTCRLLDAPVGTTGLVKEQVLYDSAGTPQEFAYSHWRSDQVSFIVGAA